MALTLIIAIAILGFMNWQNIISEIRAHGLSQVQIGLRIGRSQAWVAAASQGKYSDVRWGDGQALIALHSEVTAIASPPAIPECGSSDPRHGERRGPDQRHQADRRSEDKAL